MAITHRLMGLLSLAAAAACGGGGDGGGGAVIQVGNNLDFVPDNGVVCADGYPVQINATFPQPFTGGGAPSCLLITFFPGSQPTTDGTVESANIRIGQVTGQMRFVRARVLYQHVTGAVCCSVEQYGPIFTPQANAITTVDLRFPMTEDHVPIPGDPRIIANDLIALEVLGANIPIPGTWPNNGGSILALPNYAYFPAFTTRGLNAPTQNLHSDGSYSGFLPAYNLNFRPLTGNITVTGP
ncbi:MAG: hypothetical protein ABI742_02965 [Gemmatimonadota bacterium]